MLKDIVNGLTLEEKIGQLLCVDVRDFASFEKFEEYVKRVRPGGIFVVDLTAEQIKNYTDTVNKYARVPVIVAADIEHGPFSAIHGAGKLTIPMGWGACDDDNLIREASVECAKICRKNGVHWTFSPVVDINFNFRSPECGIRAVSDDPEVVARLTSTVIDGMQENSFMACTAKHFPGQGVDERNTHFATCVNSLSKDEWMASYGKVYKEVIKRGVKSIMLSHTSLPAFEEEIDAFYGAPPASISYSLTTKLLKGEFGFKGCVVSDALEMVGISASVKDVKKLCVKFLNAGGDMLLFPERNDFDTLLQAVEDGELKEDRVDDALLRVLELKKGVKLIGDDIIDENKIELGRDFCEIAQEVADKSITLIRDFNKILPIKGLKKGDKILLVNIHQPPASGVIDEKEFYPMKKAFEDRGYKVDILDNPDYSEIHEIMNNYAMIMLNIKYNKTSGSLRIGWGEIMTMWRAYILQHPNLVAISFGDPYKLFDFPYLRAYINAYFPTDEVQVATVRAVLGEIPFTGKSPVEFKGFFKREIK